jgi:pilus assembly protein CpaB
MDRRKILLVAAALVAILGTALVFLYVRGADQRAEKRFETVEVLKAVQPIAAGESIDDAATGGKLALQPVTQEDLMPDAQTTVSELSGQVALTTIYPGEQIVPDKFGGAEAAAEASSPLQIPKGMVAVSVSLSDPGRVAGFVNPGSDVGVFLNGADAETGQAYSRLLLPSVQVLGVGSTTTTTTTTTTTDGAQVKEELPRTLLTLALSQEDAQKVLFAQGNGELALALLTGNTILKMDDGANTDNLFK